MLLILRCHLKVNLKSNCVSRDHSTFIIECLYGAIVFLRCDDAIPVAARVGGLPGAPGLLEADPSLV